MYNSLAMHENLHRDDHSGGIPSVRGGGVAREGFGLSAKNGSGRG